MSKHAVILIALAALLTGCSGAQHRSIPVVDSGGPLTPGAMRDSRARQSGAQQQVQQTQAAAREQVATSDVQFYAVSSPPIAGI